MINRTETLDTLDPDEGGKAEEAVPAAAKVKQRTYDFSILRNLRKAQGFTMMDIARSSGISTAVISRIERNQAGPVVLIRAVLPWALMYQTAHTASARNPT